MTTIPANQAIQAYAQAAQALSNPTGAATEANAADAFSQLVENQMAGLAEDGQAFEASGMDMIQGRADVVDVVTAVAETEVLLETVVTVRDRVIQAYQEILRMPI